MSTQTRTIRTVLELNAQRYVQGAQQASKAAQGLATELGKIGGASGQQRQDYDRVANSLLGIGAAATAGLGLVSKAAMDWETSWTGVLKTVDGTPAQLQAVEDGLRGLTRELPASHQEIAAVAEAAGQLGVETDNVVEFTETMIALGVSTNLSAEEAATGLARFSNIMGTSQSDVDRLGSTIVGLGNNFATTESEILAMGMRLAGTGNQIGLTEGDVFGLATAMSSLGIEAESGGTAASMGMRKIQTAVDEGGDSLTGFAEVAGMTNEEFARLWSEDTSAGLEAFVSGLGRIGAEGGNVSSVLSDLGIKGIRESDTFLRLAGASDVLSESLAMGNSEFERNLALTEEATKFYQTTESQMAIARNSLVDAGIEMGSYLLPVLADAAGQVAGLAEAFSNLPGPVQQAIVTLGAVAGASALLGGSVMRAVPGLVEMWNGFKRLQRESPATATAISRVGKAVGIAGVAFTAATAISSYGNSLTDFSLGANEAAAAALKLADGADPLETLFDGMNIGADAAGASTQELANDLDLLANGHWYEGLSNIETGLRNVFGAGLETTDDIRQRLAEIGQGLAGLSQTDLPKAREGFENLWGAFGGTEEAGLNLLELMPEFRNELAGVANAAGMDGTDAMVLLKIATGELTPVVDETTGAVTMYEGAIEDAADETQGAVDAVNDAIDGLLELGQAFLGARDAARDYDDALVAANEAAKENGENWENGTEAARENAEAIDDLSGTVLANADAMRENGEAAGAFLEDQREALIGVAEDMGATRAEAEEYVNQLGLTPERVATQVQLDKDLADETWQAIYAELWPEGGHPPMVIEAEVDPEGKVPAFTGLVSDIPPEKDVTLGAETGEAEGRVLGFGEILDESTRDQSTAVTADVEPAIWEVNRFNTAVDEAGGSVTINGETYPADQALSTLMGIVNNSDGTVTIDGMTVPADQALARVIGIINGSDGTVTIEGNNSPANRATDSAVGHANRSSGTIDVNADTGGANSGINYAARTRYSTIRVSYSVVGGVPQMNVGGRRATGMAGGGWINPGLSEGGWVPGPYPGPGIDNTWAPLATSQGMGIQPLAGTEFVVNGRSAEQWGPALEAINAGMRPQEVTVPAPAGPSTLTLDGAALGAIADAVRTGASRATIGIGSRQTAELFNRGYANSQRLGGTPTGLRNR